jgi:hypothetical protein
MAHAHHAPTLRRRERGGWLALAHPDDPLRIAVEADSEDVARQRFAAEREAWIRLLRSNGVDQREKRGTADAAAPAIPPHDRASEFR